MNLKKIAIASSVFAGITMPLTCHAVTVTATHTVESDAEFTIDWVDAGPTTTDAKDGEVWGHLDMTQTREHQHSENSAILKERLRQDR